jgi:hypothetical protein
MRLRSKAIVGVLRGGIGNQLLQLAAYHTISRLSDRPVKLDLSSYQTKGQQSLGRSFETKYFVDKLENLEVINSNAHVAANSFMQILRSSGDIFPSLMQTMGFLTSNIRDLSNLITRRYSSARYLDSYFTGIGHNELFQESISEIVKIIKSHPSENWKPGKAAIHVRLGDYLQINPNLVPSPARYRLALDRLGHLKLDSITLFSDDPERAMNHLNPMNINIPIEVAPKYSDSLTLLTGLASHSVIVGSSSTLTWWAGLASEFSGGKVAFPDPKLSGIPHLFVPNTWQLF